MLDPYRRHTEACAHLKDGQNWIKCHCPIWAYGELDEKPFRRSLGTRDWQRALRRIEAYEMGTVEAEPAKPMPLLSAAIDQYLADCEARKIRNSTRRSYRNLLDKFKTFIGDPTLEKVDTHRLTLFRNQRKVAASTMRKDTENLRSFFKFCIGQKWIAESPVKGLKSPTDESPGALPYTRAELQTILAIIPTVTCPNPVDALRAQVRARALVLAMAWTGLRISDIAQLRRSQFDNKTGYLTIRYTQKTRVPVKLKLRAEAADALRALPIEHQDYFFWSGKSALDTVTRSLARTLCMIARLTKIHVHAHRFRDTFASELLMSGADLRTVQMLLGHTSIKTTEKHYGHFVLAHQKLLDSAVEALDLGTKTGNILPMNAGAK